MTYTNNEITIEILIGSDTTGYNTHEQNLLYVKALRSALEAEYPSANVSVDMSKDDSSICRISGFDYLDDVGEKVNLIQNRIWEGEEY